MSTFSFVSIDALHAQHHNGKYFKKKGDLTQFAQDRNRAWNRNFQRAVQLSKELQFPSSYVDDRGRVVKLQRLGHQNRPVYYTTDNLDAAKIISTSQLWTGEDEQPYLTGKGMEVNLWDGGAILDIHQEFQNGFEPRIRMREQGLSVSNHTTHVAGTIGAAGINELAKGMASMVSIFGWDYNNDIAEMAIMAAEGILLSNHSYGTICGWDYNSSMERWYWYGDPELSEYEDYQFGFYDQVSEDLDFISWSAPEYLIVKSAGNDRQDAPPDQPVGHLIWDDGWITATVERPPDGGIDGFDCLTPMSVAKNILTVGAVDDDKLISSFSAFGPTDDGRIKPDVVAGGMDVYSSLGTSFNSYGFYDGTSMAAASVTGSIALLNQLQEELQPGVNMPSSALKGILIHTAEEMGQDPGPDYQYGWGILNIKEAADLLRKNTGSGGYHMREGVIADGESVIIPIETTMSASELKITLCWTDLPGSPEAPVLNSRESKLVNDLDLKVDHVSSEQSFFPWTLNPDIPNAPAMQDENHKDNVEQVLIPDAAPGIYELIISHSGIISGEHQYFSLILSGISSPSDVYPPRLLQARAGESSIQLNWNSPENGSPDHYKIYRNNEPLAISTDTSYSDLEVKTDSAYHYYITSIYNVNGTEYESLKSNAIRVYPREYRPLPYLIDFEEGYDEILISNTPDGWLWGDSDSLSCYYLHFEENTTSFIAINSYTYGKISHVKDIAASMPLKLAASTEVNVSFDYFFVTGIYDAIDELKVMYKLPGEVEWQVLEQLPRALEWTRYIITLPDSICMDGTQIGFCYDDLYLWGFGAGMDNLLITGETSRSVDLAIESMVSPVSGCYLSDSETVTIAILNTGSEAAIPGDIVQLQLNVSPGSQSMESLVLTETLAPGESLLHTLTSTADLSEPGSYDFSILLISDFDYNTANNTFNSVIEVTGPVSVNILNQDFIYCEDDPPVLINVSPEGGTLSGPGVTGLYFNPETAGTGTHLITYTYSDQTGCHGSASVEMLVNPLPQPLILNQDLNFCEDDPPLLINVSPAGGILSGPGVSGFYFYPEVAGVGTHLITYTLTDPEGCTGTISAEVVVSPDPQVVIITEMRRFCKNDHPLHFEVSPPGGIFTGPGINDLIFDPEIAGTGNHNCTYTYTDTIGCTGSDEISLQVFDNPWIDLGSDRQVGLDDTIELEPQGNGVYFFWYNGTTEKSLSIITSELGAGRHTIWIETSNLENCTAIDSMQLTISTASGINASINSDNPSIYPNPFETGFNLKIGENEQVENLLLIGPAGQVYMNAVPSTFPYFDLPTLPGGFYILKVQTRTQHFTFQLIKTK